MENFNKKIAKFVEFTFRRYFSKIFPIYLSQIGIFFEKKKSTLCGFWILLNKIRSSLSTSSNGYGGMFIDWKVIFSSQHQNLFFMTRTCCSYVLIYSCNHMSISHIPLIIFATIWLHDYITTTTWLQGKYLRWVPN